MSYRFGCSESPSGLQIANFRRAGSISAFQPRIRMFIRKRGASREEPGGSSSSLVIAVLPEYEWRWVTASGWQREQFFSVVEKSEDKKKGEFQQPRKVDSHETTKQR